MREAGSRLVVPAALVLLLSPAALASGQIPATPAAPSQVELVPPPDYMLNDLACAPTLATKDGGDLRIVGSQDTIIKHMMGPGDTLVISGGSNEGLQPGQQFYVRRLMKTFGAAKPNGLHQLSVHTVGWIQILGVDSNISTATVLHACDGFLLDDYLEPYSPPMIAARTAPGSLPQYANMGHVVTGDEGMQSMGTGQFVNIDRGAKAGIVAGQRFLVFRDKRRLRNESPEYSGAFVGAAPRLPLVGVGELLVVAVREEDSTAQIVIATDAIAIGDFIAEIR